MFNILYKHNYHKKLFLNKSTLWKLIRISFSHKTLQKLLSTVDTFKLFQSVTFKKQKWLNLYEMAYGKY